MIEIAAYHAALTAKFALLDRLIQPETPALMRNYRPLDLYRDAPEERVARPRLIDHSDAC